MIETEYQSMPMPAAQHHPAVRPTLRQWLTPRPIDRAALFLFVTTFFLFLLRHLPPLSNQAFPWTTAGFVAASIVVLYGVDRWEYSRYAVSGARLGVRLLLMALRVVLVETIVRVSNTDRPIIYAFLPIAAALSFGIRWGYVGAVVVWVYVVFGLSGANIAGGSRVDIAYESMSLLLILVFVLGMVGLYLQERTSRQRSELLLADLEASHAQLRASSHQIAQLATVAERNRVARDIHDSLGHYLTVINVQIDKAIAFRNKDAATADQAIRDSKRLANEALDDVRRSVGVLRNQQDQVSFRTAIDDLVAPLQGAGLTIDATVCGDEQRFSTQVLTTFYRAVQEGLTNIKRHAHARTAQIVVTFDTEQAMLTINDDGQGFDLALLANTGALQRGYGLQGIQERLELVGGTLQVDSQPGVGTTLRIVYCAQPSLQGPL